MLNLPHEDTVTLHKSSTSVSCYEIPNSMVEQEHLPITLASLRDAFSWIIRLSPHDTENINSVPAFVSKGYELLTMWDDSKLIQAITFRDQDSNGLCIELIGTDKNLTDCLLDTSKRREELRRFIKSEPSKIRTIVIRLGDSPFWYVYVPRDFPEATEHFLLTAFHIDEAKRIKHRAYWFLHGMRLEKIYEDDLSNSLYK